MEHAGIMRLKHGDRVDRILGRITQIGDVRDEPSRFGPPQKVQDIELETPGRERFAVQFFDLSLRNFTGQKVDHGACADFDYRKHNGYWIELWDTQKDQGKKPSLSRIVSKPNPGKKKPTGSLHWAAKGVPILLKATRTVGIKWRVAKDEPTPSIGHVNHKRLRGLEVPGEETDMRVQKNQQGQQQGQHQQGQRGQQGQQQPPAEQQKERSGAPSQQEPPDPWITIRLGAALSFEIEDALRKAYQKGKIEVSEAFIVEAAKGCSVRFNRFLWKDMRTRVGNLSEQQRSAIIIQIALNYARMHAAYMEQLKSRNQAVPDEPMLRTKITTALSLVEDDIRIAVPVVQR